MVRGGGCSRIIEIRASLVSRRVSTANVTKSVGGGSTHARTVSPGYHMLNQRLCAFPLRTISQGGTTGPRAEYSVVWACSARADYAISSLAWRRVSWHPLRLSGTSRRGSTVGMSGELRYHVKSGMGIRRAEGVSGELRYHVQRAEEIRRARSRCNWRGSPRRSRIPHAPPRLTACVAWPPMLHEPPHARPRAQRHVCEPKWFLFRPNIAAV